jgi:hypothetical protein
MFPEWFHFAGLLTNPDKDRVMQSDAGETSVLHTRVLLTLSEIESRIFFIGDRYPSPRLAGFSDYSPKKAKIV